MFYFYIVQVEEEVPVWLWSLALCALEPAAAATAACLLLVCFCCYCYCFFAAAAAAAAAFLLLLVCCCCCCCCCCGCLFACLLVCCCCCCLYYTIAEICQYTVCGSISVLTVLLGVKRSQKYQLNLSGVTSHFASELCISTWPMQSTDQPMPATIKSHTFTSSCKSNQSLYANYLSTLGFQAHLKNRLGPRDHFYVVSDYLEPHVGA